MSKTLIFTATYNESENIKELINQIEIHDKKSDILIIDDNSPDKTSKIVENLQKTFSRLSLIVREKKSGLDTAHKLAYEYSKKKKYSKFISLDADLSHNPCEIPVIIKLLDDHPFVIGSRYIKNGKCEMSIPRLILSIFGNRFIKYFLKINCNEFTTSFRGFNINMLGDFDLNEINSKGYSFFMETIYRLNKRKIEIKEIPIIFRNRTRGISKIPKIEIFRTLKNVFFLKFFD